MARIIAELEPYLPLVLSLPFLVLGAVVSRRWARQRKLHPPPALQIAPDAWLSYWLPRTLAVEAYSLLMAGVFGFWAVFSSGAGTPAFLGGGAAIGLGVVVYVCADTVMLIRARVARNRLHAFPERDIR